VGVVLRTRVPDAGLPPPPPTTTTKSLDPCPGDHVTLSPCPSSGEQEPHNPLHTDGAANHLSCMYPYVVPACSHLPICPTQSAASWLRDFARHRPGLHSFIFRPGTSAGFFASPSGSAWRTPLRILSAGAQSSACLGVLAVPPRGPLHPGRMDDAGL